jgi:hypothetical protein
MKEERQTSTGTKSNQWSGCQNRAQSDFQSSVNRFVLEKWPKRSKRSLNMNPKKIFNQWIFVYKGLKFNPHFENYGTLLTYRRNFSQSCRTAPKPKKHTLHVCMYLARNCVYSSSGYWRQLQFFVNWGRVAGWFIFLPKIPIRLFLEGLGLENVGIFKHSRPFGTFYGHLVVLGILHHWKSGNPELWLLYNSPTSATIERQQWWTKFSLHSRVKFYPKHYKQNFASWLCWKMAKIAKTNNH